MLQSTIAQIVNTSKEKDTPWRRQSYRDSALTLAIQPHNDIISPYYPAKNFSLN
ncbi:hypothetical protein QUF58_08935 [Anaerolineales bacterium HSG24]|nr:hypothetical protein [Anaerolineales bacterium HSG24]